MTVFVLRKKICIFFLTLFLLCNLINSLSCLPPETLLRYSCSPSISFLDNPHVYKHGFLYTLTHPKIIPSHYCQVNDNLWIDKNINKAISLNNSIIIFGLVSDIRNEHLTLEEIANNLANALAISENNFHIEGDYLSGRYTIIYKTSDNITKIVNDATGMRTIYHSQDGNVIAGHAKLVADNLADSFIQPIQGIFVGGYIGRYTPYENVFLLIPNTCIETITGTIERFYPRCTLTALSAKAAASHIAPWVTTALNSIASRKKLAISLTGGIDSRSTLALSLKTHHISNILYFTYTLENYPSTFKDAALAQHICSLLDVPHKTIITDSKKDPLRKYSLDIMHINNYSKRHAPLAIQTIKNIFNDNYIHVRSNLLEIGRLFFHDVEGASKLSLDTLYKLFLRKNSSISKEKLSKLKPFIITLLQDYITTTNLTQKTLFNYDMRDIYYWEQRMATWHSQLLIEWDYALETFIPWNARAILTTMLQVPFEDRITGKLFKNIISSHCPILQQVPINPP